MQELWFLRFVRRLILIDIHITFREDILFGLQIIEWTIFFYDGQIPRETRAGVCKTLCPQLPDSNTV